MTTFDNREHGFEDKFAHDQEIEFRIIARRNKLLGLWAAEKMSLGENETQDYSMKIIEKTAQKDSSVSALKQIEEDFLSLGIKITKAEIETEMNRLSEIARSQIINE